MSASTFFPPAKSAVVLAEHPPVWLRVVGDFAVWSLMPALVLLMLGVVPDHALARFLGVSGIASHAPFDLIGVVTFVDRNCSPWFAGVSGALPHDLLLRLATAHVTIITKVYLLSITTASLSFALWALATSVMPRRMPAGMDTICWAL